MRGIADAERPVIGGVDTHAERHVAAVVNQAGRVLGTEQFPAAAAGYAAALGWMRSRGELVKVGVEGTGCYGAGLAGYLAGEGVEVVGVIRPDRQARRRRGQVRCRRCGRRRAGRAERGGVGAAEVPGRGGGIDPGGAGGPPRRHQGPRPGR